MRRIFMAAGLVAVVGLVPVPAAANEIYVGDCRNGELSRTTHKDPITGETTIVICKLPPATVGP